MSLMPQNGNNFDNNTNNGGGRGRRKAAGFINQFLPFGDATGATIEKKIGAIALYEDNEEHRVLLANFRKHPEAFAKHLQGNSPIILRFNSAEKQVQGLTLGFKMPQQQEVTSEEFAGFPAN